MEGRRIKVGQTEGGNEVKYKTRKDMIRLNCSIIAETEEKRAKAIALATELVELSLHDKGCVEYDLLGSLTNTDRLVIYETWQSEADLKAHMASEHFRRLVPAIEEVATLTLERFEF